MTTQVQPMTAEELAQLPDDGWRYELVKGEPHRMAPAGFEHGAIATPLTESLATHVRTNKLGRVCVAETGFRLASDPDTVLAPDLAFVSRDRVAAQGKVRGYWPGAPDLAAEVVSPGDSYSEVTEKAAAWLAAGTRLVLVVDPRQHTVTAYRGLNDITVLTEQDTLDGGDVVPGWMLPVREIFL